MLLSLKRFIANVLTVLCFTKGRVVWDERGIQAYRFARLSMLGFLLYLSDCLSVWDSFYHLITLNHCYSGLQHKFHAKFIHHRVMKEFEEYVGKDGEKA